MVQRGTHIQHNRAKIVPSRHGYTRRLIVQRGIKHERAVCMNDLTHISMGQQERESLNADDLPVALLKQPQCEPTPIKYIDDLHTSLFWKITTRMN